MRTLTTAAKVRGLCLGAFVILLMSAGVAGAQAQLRMAF